MFVDEELNPCRQKQNVQAAGPCISNETIPWSLEWVSQLPANHVGKNIPIHHDVGDVAVSTKEKDLVVNVAPKVVNKKKKRAFVKQSVGFMKKVARMSELDRKQILHILKKQKRHIKVRKGKNHSKEAGTSTSESSKNSNSSINHDWENWVILHGKHQAAVDDVKDIGKKVGLTFNCDTGNNFNLLTKEGRKEWRAAGGSEVGRGSMGDDGRNEEGC